MMVTWFVLNALDLTLTLGIIALGGVEVAPVAGWLLSRGVIFFALARSALTIVAAYVLSKMNKRVLWVCNVGMALVVGWNLVVMVAQLKLVE